MKIRFGEFSMDTGARQLFRRDDEIHLTPKAFDLLVWLVERRPNAISKAELHDRLWPSTFVVEANLAILVAEVRAALGDSARQPRFIRTLHRYGYAFAADVVESRAAARPSSAPVCWLMGRTYRFSLDEGEHIVGRAPDADVSIDAASVSRRHARIAVTREGATIEDLGSKNGTWVRGKRITGSERLSDGDAVRFGSMSLKFRSWSAGVTTRSTTPPTR